MSVDIYQKQFGPDVLFFISHSKTLSWKMVAPHRITLAMVTSRFWATIRTKRVRAIWPKYALVFRWMCLSYQTLLLLQFSTDAQAKHYFQLHVLYVFWTGNRFTCTGQTLRLE